MPTPRRESRFAVPCQREFADIMNKGGSAREVVERQVGFDVPCPHPRGQVGKSVDRGEKVGLSQLRTPCNCMQLRLLHIAYS